MTTMAQNQQLLKQLFELVEASRGVVKQERVFERVKALVLAELFAFARHTVTQLLMGLGQTEEDWSSWYRLFGGRFNYEHASAVLVQETLRHVPAEAVYVVAGDATQTPRSSRSLEGVSWLRHPRTPPFHPGIHLAQRWFNGCWLAPAEAGYSRAFPIRWQPAFTEASQAEAHPPKRESEAAVDFLGWLRARLEANGRAGQTLLLVGDGRYDSLPLWSALSGQAEETVVLVRSAKNRALYQMPPEPGQARGRKRLYGARAPTPQALWQERTGWQRLTLSVRGRERPLQVKVRGPFLRRGAAGCPLFLIVVRGKDHGPVRREPLPYLVNARRTSAGSWQLPLPLETLLFWAWQRWEIEVCHRELKSNFGLGNKQCFNPIAAVTSVQWSAWVYTLFLLAGYRTFGLARAGDHPTRWWPGAYRWSFNSLWRSYRAAFWQHHEFLALCTPFPANWGEKEVLLAALRNAVLAAARA